MQIFGIGTDIVQSARIASMFHEHGDKFPLRILTEYEFAAYSELKNNQVAFLAKRFAAKEAIAKALGTGFREQVLLKQVGIETDPNGKPSVVFYGTTKAFVETLGKLDIHISLADEAEYVVAFVVIAKM